ncbi:MAG: NAD(+)/NADH kinase, partial [Paenibacillus sp.]|nr:NAD(+)/NADH kinase [Paenibacillus sp.]
TFHVLNEIIVDRGPSSNMSMLELFGDERHLTTVQADGLCIATQGGGRPPNQKWARAAGPRGGEAAQMRGLLDQIFGRLSRPNSLSRRRYAPPGPKKPNHFVVGFFLSLKFYSLNLRDSFRVKSLMSLVSH